VRPIDGMVEATANSTSMRSGLSCVGNGGNSGSGKFTDGDVDLVVADQHLGSPRGSTLRLIVVSPTNR